MKQLLINLILLVCLAYAGHSQSCNETLTIKVVESEDRDIPVAAAKVVIQEIDAVKLTDGSGSVVITSLCAGQYHIIISQIGHETETILITVPSQEVIVPLKVHLEIIDEVEVVPEHPEDTPGQVSATITEEAIDRRSNQTLADITESIAGVSTLRTGSTIGKPIIHGLYGNRVIVLNNGLVQAGQQWGNDHAPEIDVNVAQSITVVKGVDAIVYGGNALGGMVLVRPGNILAEPHLHGKVKYRYNLNGRGHSISSQIKQGGDWARWRATGTFKRSGDRQASNYFLTNTGAQEINAALQVEKNLSEKWASSLYFSTFNTELAILRASHIGNETDLKEALEREVPFFTEDDFSYTINAPSQKVNHHLAKLELRHFISDYQDISLTYGFQANNRKEFDVRRGNRSAIPALDMQLYDNMIDAHYHGDLAKDLDIYAGLGAGLTTNNNNPDTGIFPLIPDYDKLRAWSFMSFKKKFDHWDFGGGLRYEFNNQDVATFSRTVPITVVNYDDNFHKVSVAFGAEYEKENYKTQINAGYTNRSPEVNERFSNGLHQGVAAIEEGDPNLHSESALKFVWSNKLSLDSHSQIGIDVYTQFIDNFIYLNPQSDPRLTIRGAFPVYLYEQTKAGIHGIDLYGNYRITPQLDAGFKAAFLRGHDTANDIPLIYMPPNNLKASLEYLFKDGDKWQHSSFQVSGEYVFEQTHFIEGQGPLDTVPPPGFFLLNARAETDLSLGKNLLRFSLSGTNLTNTAYRDYLNRLHYFADEVDLDLHFGLNFVF